MDEVTKLFAKLHDRDCYVRWQAAAELGKIKDAQAVPLLIQALEDKDTQVRQSAVYALWKIQDPRVVPALIAALKPEDWQVCIMTAMALSEIASRDPSPALRDALPTLRPLRHSYKLPVFQEALDKIEAATAGMKDLPLPAAAPLPDATSLPRPSTVLAVSPDALPIPSAPAADKDATVRKRRWWIRRGKRH